MARKLIHEQHWKLSTFFGRFSGLYVHTYELAPNSADATAGKVRCRRQPNFGRRASRILTTPAGKVTTARLRGLLGWRLNLSFRISQSIARTYFMWNGHFCKILLIVSSGICTPIFIEIGSYLTDTEQNVSWRIFETLCRSQEGLTAK